MPFKSKAQRRKFAELLVKGEISDETFEEWNRETGGAKLPERVKPSKKRSSKPASRKRVGKAKAGSQSKGTRKRVTKRAVRRKNT
jgi:hypothetical protein